MKPDAGRSVQRGGGSTVRCIAFTLAFAVVVALFGCASGPEPVEVELDRTVEEAIPDRPLTEVEADPVEVEGAGPGSGALSVRDDGRPSWWFSETRRSGEAVVLCAEALGPDMNAARTGAILVSRGRLRRALDLGEGEALPDVTVLQTWVWPLPNAAAGAANRYAGYVMVEAMRGP